jgi:hypothetical protein
MTAGPYRSKSTAIAAMNSSLSALRLPGGRPFALPVHSAPDLKGRPRGLPRTFAAVDAAIMIVLLFRIPE